MPAKALKPCCYPGCAQTTTERFCALHKRTDDMRRGTAAQRGYDARWRRLRRQFLQANPLCVECSNEGQITAASVVDHIRPHKGDVSLLYSWSNLQSLCPSHHNRKTATQDGGFGR